MVKSYLGRLCAQKVEKYFLTALVKLCRKQNLELQIQVTITLSFKLIVSLKYTSLLNNVENKKRSVTPLSQ